MDHQTSFCASLGHFVATTTLIYCPHQQAWTMVAYSGDDADDMCIDRRIIRFGPFDQLDDVVDRARSHLAHQADAHRERFLERRSAE